MEIWLIDLSAGCKFLRIARLLRPFEELDGVRLSKGPVVHGAVAPSQPRVVAFQSSTVSVLLFFLGTRHIAIPQLPFRDDSQKITNL
jgi:hypothetical protein